IGRSFLRTKFARHLPAFRSLDERRQSCATRSIRRECRKKLTGISLETAWPLSVVAEGVDLAWFELTAGSFLTPPSPHTRFVNFSATNARKRTCHFSS